MADIAFANRIKKRYCQQELSKVCCIDSLTACDMRRLAFDVGVSIICVIIVEYIVKQLVFLLLGYCYMAGLKDYYVAYTAAAYIASSIISYLPKMAVFYVLYKKYSPLYKLLPVYENKVYQPLLVLPLVFAFGMWGSQVTNLINNVLQILFGVGEIPDVMQQTAPIDFGTAVVTITSSSLIAPFAEEFIYRRLLLRPLRVLGDTPAVVLSALIFGLAHGNFDQFAYCFFSGIIFGLVAVRCGSILPTVVLHIINNFFVSVITYKEQLKCGEALIDNLTDAAAAVGNAVVNVSYFGGVFFLVLLIASGFARLVPVSDINRREKLNTVFCPVFLLALAVMLIEFAY